MQLLQSCLCHIKRYIMLPENYSNKNWIKKITISNWQNYDMEFLILKIKSLLYLEYKFKPNSYV
jgi:hypothetical protein